MTRTIGAPLLFPRKTEFSLKTKFSMAFKLFSVSVRYKVICWNEMHFCDLDDFFFFSQLLTIDTFLDE
jgi:hypothetical protein